MKNGEKPIANPCVMLREEFDDWAILFNPDAAPGFGGFGLSPTGVYLWKFLDGEHSIDDMLTALRRDAEEVPEDAGEQVVAFVERLTEQGLVGYGGEKARDERERPSPCLTCGGAIQFKYESPKLIDLTGGHAAYGASCPSGSAAAGGCNVGAYAGGSGCYVNGQYATTLCSTGGYDSVKCGMGAGNASDCESGSTAAGHCSGGGWPY